MMESLNNPNCLLGNISSDDGKVFESNQYDLNPPVDFNEVSSDINIEPTEDTWDFQNNTPTDGPNLNVQEILPVENMNDSNQNLLEEPDEDSDMNVDEQLTANISSLSLDDDNQDPNQSNNATNEFFDANDNQEDLDFPNALKKETNNANNSTNSTDIKKDQDESKSKIIDEINLGLTNLSIKEEKPSPSNAHKLKGCKNDPKSMEKEEQLTSKPVSSNSFLPASLIFKIALNNLTSQQLSTTDRRKILNKIATDRTNLRSKVLRKKGGNIRCNKRPNLPLLATKILKDWLNEHSYPFPTATEKLRLVKLTGLKLSQINNWFIYARRFSI